MAYITLLLALVCLLTYCFHSPKTVAAAAHLPEEAYPLLKDICPEATMGQTKVICEGAHLSGTGPHGRWAKTVDARDLNVGALFHRYLVTTATVEGTFTFTQTTVIDVQDGSVLLDNDGALIHVDPARRILLFVPTGPAVGQATSSPTLYRLDLKSRAMEIKTYTIQPRPSCGKDEDDITGAPGNRIVYVSGSRMVFPRQDLCGAFDFSVPLP